MLASSNNFFFSEAIILPSCSGSINSTVAGDFASNINGKTLGKWVIMLGM